MKVGFIGLGIMGKPMALNILRNGYPLTVYGHSGAVLKEFEEKGALVGKSEEDVANKSDVIITMVQNSPEVSAIVEKITKNSVLAETVIDMSSIDPNETVRIGNMLGEKGIDMLDAPVSGGEQGAIDAKLSVMVGGREEVFEKYLPLLKTMAASVVRVGNLGSGNTAKLANQIIVASNIAALAEALTFAKKNGADPNLVFQAIRGGLAGSLVMEQKAPLMIRGEYKPGFRVELHMKDLKNTLNAALSASAPVPITSLVMEMFSFLKAYGFEKEDHSALIRFYEKISASSISG